MVINFIAIKIRLIKITVILVLLLSFKLLSIFLNYY